LELRFRPNDTFCKPTCGDRSTSSSLLLRVRRVVVRRKKCGSCQKPINPENPEPEIRTEILAPIKTTFAFNNLCDFQYLPTETTKELKEGESEVKTAKPRAFVHKPILDKVHFDKLIDSKWLSEEAPLFIPPAAFSRMDQPQDYHYRKDTSGTALRTATGTPLNIIGRTRQRRTLHAVFVNYDIDKVPEKPSEVAVNQLKVKFIESDEKQRVVEAFETQPIWTKSGLNFEVDVSMERLKFILPTVAYYFTSGPWRNQWTRFGYDPRKDPSAHIYQTLDYRVRIEGGAKLKVRAKRSYANYLLPYKSMNWSKPKTSTIVRETFEDGGEAAAASRGPASKGPLAPSFEDDARSRYLFEDGMVPPHRQMFYQYKDILLPEVQKIFKDALKDQASKEVTMECDEKFGWYKAGADDKVRTILTNSVTKTLTSNLKKEDMSKDEMIGDVVMEDELDDQEEAEDLEDMGEIVDEVMEEEEQMEAVIEDPEDLDV